MTETEKPLRLPRANEAVIDPKKLRDYALNPDHGHGREKARVFQSALGIGRSDWRYLRKQILRRVPRGEVSRIEPRPGRYTYHVTILVDGLNGATLPVATRWVVHGDEPPWFSSCWVDI